MLILSVRRIWLMVALFALITATGSVAAWQLARPEATRTAVDLIAQDEEDDIICPPGEADCEVTDEDERGGDGNGDGDGSGSGSGNSSGGACTYTHSDVVAAALAAQTTTVEVPCYIGGGVGWYDGEGCYYGDFPPIREATDGIPEPPEGKTEEDGRYYYLTCLANVEIFNGELLNFTLQTLEQWVWVDFEDVPTITPEQVFLQWYATATLNPVEPVLAPPAGTAGLVGLPVWLGLNETENSLSLDPPTVDHCIDGVCVTISAWVTEVVWNMGDGSTVTCQPDEHTVWRPGMDFLAPSGCHHYYHRTSRNQPDGRYEITATSTWRVEWTAEASGLEGFEEPERTGLPVSLQIDEIQVLTGS